MSSIEAAETKDQWQLFRFVLGNWVGTGTGSSGTSSVRVCYALTLADQSIEIRNRSEFPPQKNNSSDEVYKDRGFISYDKMRNEEEFRETFDPATGPGREWTCLITNEFRRVREL